MAIPCDYRIYLAQYKEICRRFPGNDHKKIEEINQMAKTDWRVLGHLSEKQIDFMFTLVLQHCEFWPTPAKMLSLFPKPAPDDTEERALLWAQDVANRLMMPTDGRPYNRAVLDEDEDEGGHIKAVFHEMGGGYKTEWGFGRWPKASDRYKRNELIEKLKQRRLGKRGLTAGESRKFLQDSGFDDIIKPIDDDDDDEQPIGATI